MFLQVLRKILGPIHTYPDHFENASFLIRFGFASTRRWRLRSPKTKLLENVDLFENAVFLFSCGRVKTELFETLTFRMRSVLWGSREGNLLICFLLSEFECRISLSNMEFHYFFFIFNLKSLQ